MASITHPAAPRKTRHTMVKDHDRRMFALSDDNALMKQIIATHAPDGREVEVKPILQIIGDVFRRATPTLVGVLNGTPEHVDTEDKSTVPALDFDDILEALAFLIYKISCELSCKCSGGGDAHGTTMALLNTLTSFSWDSKVVLTLAAFAVNYGEFWLVAQLCTKNPLAKSVAFLKQLPNIVEYSSSLKPQFEALNKLIKAVMDVATRIVEFTELPSQFISDETPAVKAVTSHLPAATYWTIRSVVACSTQIASLIGLRLENSTALTTEAWELSSLAHKVTNIHEHLKSQLALCYQHIEEKKHLEYFHTLVRLFETLHLDNFKILRALLHPKEELVIGSSKKKVNIEALKRKHVLLLISDLDIPHDEITILGHLYQQDPIRKTDQTQYEVVWFPVVDRLSPHADQEKAKIKFQELQSMMQWYSVIDPWTVEPAVIKYIKEMWSFNKKSILVSLDPQGRVASSNALHMMWIWGTLAIPFSVEKEETLWKSAFWGLALLIDGIDTTVIDSMGKGNIICMYGGEDIEWIRKFTTSAKNVAKEASITLDLLYVGKSKAKERVQKTNSIISTEHLSHFWDNLTYVWFFWTRLESMLYSKMKSGKTVENDPIMEEVMTMLSFDGSDKGWAVVSGGPPDHEEIIARGSGEIALKTMEDFGNWKDDAVNIGFVPAFKEHLRKLHSPQHCNRLILPGITGEIPERIVCAECRRPMEKYFMYRCCTD
ncbi:protein SIEVE ELEMENT OCCLUSION B-like isoform X1 [Carya illinoinensis]|uniref:Protein SIEVE ELEMENT OCCLUSION B-like n=1 Tax=Carya illinoinensis TaxID=32201 RepID=A0A8T1P297_CARIL|nr:protein SIEVE ELEMENT OCCLUSION B-like isoform X1 [Carya illinoinensis]KAG6635040.1 hypothetical protein CIPAW_11G014900 [Carya illinoinensis]